MRHVNEKDRTLLELQNKTIHRLIEEIDDILEILQEQQEAIDTLERCVVTLQRIILKERES